MAVGLLVLRFWESDFLERFIEEDRIYDPGEGAVGWCLALEVVGQQVVAGRALDVVLAQQLADHVVQLEGVDGL